jgi:hypothetical protein
MNISKLSEYEKKRLETIQRNQEMLRQLGLDQSAEVQEKPKPKVIRTKLAKKLCTFQTKAKNGE